MNASARLKMDSPVAYPHLFAVEQTPWMHWDDNTNAEMQRNMGQAIGVGAVLAFDKKGQITGTTLRPDNLAELERLAKKIEPPKWPFAKPDAKLVKLGERMFKQECASCHERPLPDPKTVADSGTDCYRRESFKRTVGDKTVPKVLGEVLTKVEKAAKSKDPDRTPEWRFTNYYGLRSLEGVWATAPYLHNDSVLTLAALLSPSKRLPKFTIEKTKYDRDNVGLMPRQQDSEFEFDTKLPGNSNGGHVWGQHLFEHQKEALLAYLKLL
jgi:hypothetical protein